MAVKPLVVILMGSPSDREHVDQIVGVLEPMGVECRQQITSAHKTPQRLLDLLAEFEADPRPKVYITVAGRSNALSGMVDASVSAPVIACPPIGSSFGGADLYSSLRMPSGVAPMVVLDPGNAGLAAAKILGLVSSELSQAVGRQQADHRKRLAEADSELGGG
jgi:5-(carboxyamino)imidazole ribonucleotide mutase/phosphoribosylaminoimidazole-succinocarboxamide synthase